MELMFKMTQDSSEPLKPSVTNNNKQQQTVTYAAGLMRAEIDLKDFVVGQQE